MVKVKKNISAKIYKNVAEGRMPFKVNDPFYSKANQAELDKRFEKLADNKNIHFHHLIDLE